MATTAWVPGKVFRRSRSFFARAALGLALTTSLVYVATAVAWAHELRIIPSKRPGDTRATLLPIVVPGAHLSLPGSVDFGSVEVGTSAVAPLALSNLTEELLTLELALEGGAGEVSLSQSELTLAAGAEATVSLTYAPVTRSVLSGSLVVRSRHAGVGLPVEDTIALTGQAFLGPTLELRIDGYLVNAYDFGEVSRRPHLSVSTAPSFQLEIANVGDVGAAVNVSGLVIVGCSTGTMAVCMVGPGGAVPPLSVPAGAAVMTTWWLFPDDVGPWQQTLTLTPLGGDPVPLTLAAEGVPYLTDAGIAQAVAAGTDEKGQTVYAIRKMGQISGDNIDAAANDPLAVYRPTGFDAAGLFDLGDFDSVEARSGSLTLTVPLVSHTVRGGLSYSLAATYNSNAWARKSIYRQTAEGAQTLNSEYPDPANNTGMGWSLHMGRLRGPQDLDALPDLSDEAKELAVDTGPYWVYMAPGGSRHRFTGSLNHPYNPHRLGADLGTRPFLYARDGSFLRLRRVSGSERHVEFPDGRALVFRHHGSTLLSNRDPWRLEEIRDPFGNSVTISYTSLAWTITDPWRETTVAFRTTGSFHYPAVVESVSTAGFDGGPARTFTFTYTPTLATVDRPPGDTYAFFMEAPRVSVPLVQGIERPDGTTWGFTYNRTAGDMRELRLTEAALPTGGRVGWEYERVPDTTIADCYDGGVWQAPWSVGVNRRFALDIDGTRLADTRYLRRTDTERDDFPDGDLGACFHYVGPQPPSQPPVDYSRLTPPAELRVGVWSQLENGLSSLQVEYFSIWPFEPHPDSQQGWTSREKGLNITRAEPKLRGRFLSGQLYSCARNVGAGVGLSTLMGSQCVHHESRYARYELPRSDTCEARGGTPCAIGSRLVEEETVYVSDNSRFRSVVRSDYDGLGHYRRSQTGGNFNRGNAASTFKDWNSGNGTLTLLPNGLVDDDIEGLPANWILNTYTTDTVTEGGVTRGGEACFKSGTGWLRAVRTFEGGSRGPWDLVTVNQRNPEGELIRRSLFGADTYGGNLSIGNNWCDDSFWPASKRDYAIEYQYQAGLLARQRVIDAQSNGSVYEVWREIDPGTGWVKSSVANSGEEVTFTYDAMGRVRSTSSDAAARGVITFAAPQGGQGWKLTAKTFRRGTSILLAEYQADYDGLGRVVAERFRHPDGTLKEQATTYHDGGQVASRSSLNQPAQATAFRYDFKGRLRSRTLPDGTEVTFGYRGVRIEDRIADVTGPNGTVRSVARSERDGQGRAWKVEVGQLNGATLAVTHSTTFTFDPLGQTTSATRGVQTRTWGYDGRRFLVSEEIPEKAARRVFSDFNTRGQAETVEEKEGAALRRTERWAFDVLGRPELLVVDGATIKDWTYFPRCTALDLDDCSGSNGQLQRAVRHNRRTRDNSGGLLCTTSDCVRENFEVATTFGYDAAGRVSSKELEVLQRSYDVLGFELRTETSGHFDQSWVYDDLGRVTSLTYPRVIHPTDPECEDTPPPQRHRQVGFQYVNGLLTRVIEGGLGATLGYHDDGSIASIHHDNAKLDLFGADPSGASRVGSIRLAANPATELGGLNLGAFGYDAAGNITAIGSETFRYDAAERLVRATVRSDGASGTTTFNYSYDDYDNRTDWGTVDATTNQLIGGLTYDPFGNLNESGDGTLVQYDAVHKVVALYETPEGDPATDFCTRPVTGAQVPCTLSLYDHDDLRIFTFRSEPGAQMTWTLRDLAGRVLTEYVEGGVCRVKPKKDYVYAGSRLLSSETIEDGVRRHYHLDHLGSTRVVTDSAGSIGTRQHYEPFGGLIHGGLGERIDFSGHEREGDDLTMYMRARQYLIPGGRFLQVDPGRDATSWSLYAYGANNPIANVDPTGNSVLTKAIKVLVKVGRKGGRAVIEDPLDALGIAEDVAAASQGDPLAILSLASEFAPVSVSDIRDVAKGFRATLKFIADKRKIAKSRRPGAVGAMLLDDGTVAAGVSRKKGAFVGSDALLEDDVIKDFDKAKGPGRFTSGKCVEGNCLSQAGRGSQEGVASFVVKFEDGAPLRACNACNDVLKKREIEDLARSKPPE